MTRILRRPKSGSSDTVFTFQSVGCDGCKYEYRLFNGAKTKLYRNWSLHSSPLDYKNFLKKGLYHIQVRRDGTRCVRCVSVHAFQLVFGASSRCRSSEASTPLATVTY